jgi:hypothetical protein
MSVLFIFMSFRGKEHDAPVSPWVDVVLVHLKIIHCIADPHDFMTEHPVVSENHAVSIFVAEGVFIAVKREASYPSKEMIPEAILEVLRQNSQGMIKQEVRK